MIYWSKVCKIIAHKVVKSLEQKHVCLFGEWYLDKNKFHLTDVFGKVKTAFLFAYLYYSHSRQNKKNFRMKEQFEYLIKAVWNVLYWTFENFVGFKAPTLLTGPPLSLLKYTTVNQPGHIVHILAITITANYWTWSHNCLFKYDSSSVFREVDKNVPFRDGLGDHMHPKCWHCQNWVDTHDLWLKVFGI